MKNIQRRLIPSAAAFLLLFALVFTVSSCKREGPARARITVVNSKGVPIEGATVTLHQDTIKSPVTGAKASVSDVQTSDADGKTTHEFPLESILNVDVKKGALRASDYIRLERSKTVDKTIVLK